MSTRRASRSSAGAVFLNKTQRLDHLRQAAARLADVMPTVQRVRLFGSLTRGIPTPRSDADLLVVLGESAHQAMRDRIPDVLAALSPLPCPVDLFVLTKEEFDRASQNGDPLVQEALAHGLDLFVRSVRS